MGVVSIVFPFVVVEISVVEMVVSIFHRKEKRAFMVSVSCFTLLEL